MKRRKFNLKRIVKGKTYYNTEKNDWIVTENYRRKLGLFPMKCSNTGTIIVRKKGGTRILKQSIKSTGLRGSIKTGDNKHLKEPTHLRGSSFVSSAETPRNDCAEHTVSDVKARNGREQRERHLRISANPKLISREKA